MVGMPESSGGGDFTVDSGVTVEVNVRGGVMDVMGVVEAIVESALGAIVRVGIGVAVGPFIILENVLIREEYHDCEGG